MLTDYKFMTVTRDESSTRATVRFYEGEVNTLNEPDEKGTMQPITRYRRSKMLRILVLDFPSPISESELISNLNACLALSWIRTPIPEQRNA